MSIFCAVKVHNRVKCDHASEAVSFGACLEHLQFNYIVLAKPGVIYNNMQ